MPGRALRRASSRLFGWLADRRVPRPLRAPLYGAYARLYRVDLSEVRLALADHPSLGAFFVRRLVEGARSFPADPSLLPSPADGRLQALDPIRDGTLLQAKGSHYPVAELLGPLAGRVHLEGGHAWTIYLSPRDYHRVHSPEDARIEDVAWIAGERRSVGPGVLARRPRVLCTNERAVLLLSTDRGPLLFVMVGALNVGRIRILGVEPGRDGPPEAPRELRRGEELGRFEMGSTVVLLAPRDGPRPQPGLSVGSHLSMGDVLGVR